MFAIGRRGGHGAVPGPAGGNTGIATCTTRAWNGPTPPSGRRAGSAVRGHQRRHTKERLAGVLDPGLEPANPLDMWGTGRESEHLLPRRWPRSPTTRRCARWRSRSTCSRVRRRRLLPHAVNSFAAPDRQAARRARHHPRRCRPGGRRRGCAAGGSPVLEYARSGLLALRHLLDHAARPDAPHPPPSPTRRGGHRWARAAHGGEPDGAPSRPAPRLRDPGRPGLPGPHRRRRAGGGGRDRVPGGAQDRPARIAHKSDAGGVVLGIRAAALARRLPDGRPLGPPVSSARHRRPGTELALGITRDPGLGPLVVVGPGGLLVEFLADRAVALPPVTRHRRCHAGPAARGRAAGRGPRPASRGHRPPSPGRSRLPRSPLSSATTWRRSTSTR